MMTRISASNPWPEIDGRWLAGLMVVVYFLLILLAANLLKTTVAEAWCFMGVPALPSHFEDLKQIAVGIDKLNSSPHPWSAESIASGVAAYNYPRWWLYAGYLGFNLKTTHAFGSCLGILFLASSLFVLGRVRLREGFFAGLLLVSPSVMLCVERANADLVIFLLLTSALVMRRVTPLATFLILAAALLKIYPLAALVALAAPPWRKSLPWIALAVAVFAITTAATYRDFQRIASHVTHVEWYSFGSAIVLLRWQRLSQHVLMDTYPDVLIVGSALFCVVAILALWTRPRFTIPAEWERELYSFRIGAALFVGSFALGSNFDYRTIVLIFCLPLLFQLIRRKEGAHRDASLALLLILGYTTWHFFIYDEFTDLFFLKQGAAWGLAACLIGLLAGTYQLHPASEVKRALTLEGAPTEM